MAVHDTSNNSYGASIIAIFLPAVVPLWEKGPYVYLLERVKPIEGGLSILEVSDPD